MAPTLLILRMAPKCKLPVSPITFYQVAPKTRGYLVIINDVEFFINFMSFLSLMISFLYHFIINDINFLSFLYHSYH